MECLVDDTMNSNIFSNCPECGMDSLSPANSGDLCVHCENRQSAINSTGVNNNTMLTHRDFVPSPDLPRPRCCSCLEKTHLERSPGSPELAQKLDISQTRPRSCSSPNQPISHEQSERNLSRSLYQNFCHNHSPRNHLGVPADGTSDVFQYDSLTLNSPPHCSGSQVLPADTPPPILERASSRNLQTCPGCGSVVAFSETSPGSVDGTCMSTNVNIQQSPCQPSPISSWCSHADTQQGDVNSQQGEVNIQRGSINTQHSDINIQQCSIDNQQIDISSQQSSINSQQSPINSQQSSVNIQQGDVNSQLSPASEIHVSPQNYPDASTAPLSPEVKHAASVTISVEADFDTSTPILASLDQLVAQPDDPEASKMSSTSPVGQELPAREACPKARITLHGTESHVRPTYLHPDQFTIHNAELNRIRTAARAQATRSSRITHGHFHAASLVSRPSSRSVQSMTGPVPMVITPDSPVPNLPSEFLYELHGLGHENEDLSAEVVYSLHFRDYQIKELLGKGISSTVRRVTEKSSGTEYAVKIIDISGEKGEIAQLDQVKKDTYREISILRMCAGHSNIIELHDVFETPTFIFLVFEICRKGELFDYLTSVVSLSEKRTRIFMRQLIEAVVYIHDKNIVHRDLKPENILLDDQLNIKVSDFGFATVIEDGEELTELCGTPGYLAPEVLAHSMYENVSGYGKEVDMWACGVIMYTLLCGAPPFWNRRQMMMLRAIMNADYTFNSPEWDDITEAPKNLIQKLLVVNPKDRLTAKEALKHPFFHSQVAEEKKFQARRKFRAAAACIVFYLRLNFYSKHPPPISMDMIRSNPYGVKIMRKIIDTCAFGMYKHWVKRVDNQNRAALFEHTLRDDWKHTPMTIDGVRL